MLRASRYIAPSTRTLGAPLCARAAVCGARFSSSAQPSGRPRVLLLYSGGLDTSVILRWLVEEGYEVVCYMANLGQAEDWDKARAKGLKVGAKAVHVGAVGRGVHRGGGC